MDSKVFYTFGSVSLIAIFILIFNPFKGNDSKEVVSKDLPIAPIDSTEETEKISVKEAADIAYKDFVKLKASNSLTPTEIDEELVLLQKKYPSDYRFILERIKGEKMISNGNNIRALELLKRTAKIALESNEADNLHTELLNGQSVYYEKIFNVFPDKWNALLNALEKESIEELNEIEIPN